MTEPKDLPERKGTPPISKQAAYSKAAASFNEAFDTILWVMRNSENPSDKLGAARTIVSKVIPDLKAAEITGEGGQALRIIIEDYGSPRQLTAQTEGSNTKE